MGYSFSAILMVLLIALYSGIDGISVLIGIAGAVAMILFAGCRSPPIRRDARR